MIITILTDSPKSWFVPYGKVLCDRFHHSGHNAVYVHDKNEIREGDICFLLSCTKIVQPRFLRRNRHNIVVHASDLPAGKGFAPVKWQILEGKNTIPITLFEAVEAVDAGDWYLKDKVHYEGHELLGEIHDTMARKINDMCVRFVAEYEEMTPRSQSGEESFYPRLTPEDDRIDPEKSVSEQWNRFRIADDDRFPRWFLYMGHKYIVRIEKAASDG
jgi:methionyl-tRNA formyltransferase